MAEPFVGEIRIFAGNFAPAGWEFCRGQLLPISENDTLFALVGTTYGGDGQETFALPDLQGRVPVHQGQGPGLTQNNTLGATFGVDDVTLTQQTTPNHTHPVQISADLGTSANPVGKVLARATDRRLFVREAPASGLPASSVSVAGGNQPHTNTSPVLAINFIISLFGIFPSQS